eukprot:Rhum_TRINITY_DN12054_c1_g1::Rhum_TRINITY_DN12054_c1_g1_i1::g.48880::m.48880
MTPTNRTTRVGFDRRNGCSSSPSSVSVNCSPEPTMPCTSGRRSTRSHSAACTFMLSSVPDIVKSSRNGAAPTPVPRRCAFSAAEPPMSPSMAKLVDAWSRRTVAGTSWMPTSVAEPLNVAMSPSSLSVMATATPRLPATRCSVSSPSEMDGTDAFTCAPARPPPNACTLQIPVAPATLSRPLTLCCPSSEPTRPLSRVTSSRQTVLRSHRHCACAACTGFSREKVRTSASERKGVKAVMVQSFDTSMRKRMLMPLGKTSMPKTRAADTESTCGESTGAEKRMSTTRSVKAPSGTSCMSSHAPDSAGPDRRRLPSSRCSTTPFTSNVMPFHSTIVDTRMLVTSCASPASSTHTLPAVAPRLSSVRGPVIIVSVIDASFKPCVWYTPVTGSSGISRLSRCSRGLAMLSAAGFSTLLTTDTPGLSRNVHCFVPNDTPMPAGPTPVSFVASEICRACGVATRSASVFEGGRRYSSAGQRGNVAIGFQSVWMPKATSGSGMCSAGGVGGGAVDGSGGSARRQMRDRTTEPERPTQSAFSSARYSRRGRLCRSSASKGLCRRNSFMCSPPPSTPSSSDSA